MWVFRHPATVMFRSLVMAETWQWTPLVIPCLIVLGGLAAIDPPPEGGLSPMRARQNRRRHRARWQISPEATISLHR